jgi:Ni,Fe-hydrogenase III component G
MSAQSLAEAQTLLAPWAKEKTTPEVNRLDVVVDAADLFAAVRMLHEREWGYLAAITGLDSLATNEIQVLYHICSGANIVTLRVRVPRTNASAPSVCEIIPSASAYERELREMFGVEVVGTPDASRLLVPDDLPEGVYPLRKDWVK